MASLSTTVVWARLQSLPIEYYDHHILRRIGSKLGKLLKIDVHTENGARGRFACLCLQVDMAKPLIPKLLVGAITVRIAYEGINAICFLCGLIRHTASECQPLLIINPQSSQQGTVMPSSSGDEVFGPWMLVQSKGELLKKPMPVKHTTGKSQKVWQKKVTNVQILAPSTQGQAVTSLTHLPTTFPATSNQSATPCVPLHNLFVCLSNPALPSLVIVPCTSFTFLAPSPTLPLATSISDAANSDPLVSRLHTTLFCLVTTLTAMPSVVLSPPTFIAPNTAPSLPPSPRSPYVPPNPLSPNPSQQPKPTTHPPLSSSHPLLVDKC
ncbi:hypothetical protein LOK49_LG07G00964 [Camellia lanceoleosa]|uniref:Uncharacterized protein n=1 Tax=Camellia lanceoleosa TaxID=1840588 RepID=A0ACC0GYF0_9ERIC|nr:hypothetical protein LOK49_LG07G00964 [Camellia lanceoleosa]